MIRLPGSRSLLAAACSAALLVACKPAPPKPFNGEGLSGPQIVPPLPKPDLVLTTTDGKPFDIRKDTEGYITLLFFGYTNCPDVCPVHMANIAGAMRKLGPDITNRIKVVFVTVDPSRDTPEVIRTWLNHFDDRFIGLRGDSASVASAFTQLRLGPAMREAGPDSTAPNPVQYTIGHSAIVLAYGTDNLAHVVYPFGIRQADWSKDLTLLVERS
ncbi:MAG: SCO family protein [Gemmatimonadales bacterium]